MMRCIPVAHRPNYADFLLFAGGAVAVMGATRVITRIPANDSPWSGAIAGSICGFLVVGWCAGVMLGAVQREWLMDMIAFALVWTVFGACCVALVCLLAFVLGASEHQHFGVGGDIAIGFFSALAMFVVCVFYGLGSADISSRGGALALIQLAVGPYFSCRGAMMQRRDRTTP